MKKINSFLDYQTAVTKVKKYKEGQEDLYLLAKLTEESGEVAKEVRKKVEGKEVKSDFANELGDLLWCIAAIAQLNNISLQEVVDKNLEKLKDRNLL